MLYLANDKDLLMLLDYASMKSVEAEFILAVLIHSSNYYSSIHTNIYGKILLLADMLGR